MDKKDIYEHLAKIYLDASTQKKKKIKESSRFKYLVFASLAIALSLTIILSGYFRKNKQPNVQISLVLLNEASKINFNFDPAKKEIYAISLNKLNLGKFTMLAFALKKYNYTDNVSVRVEFINAFREKSEVYLKNISSRWQDYKIKLGDFKGISDWSEMADLSFIVEEWNAKGKKGVVYIDNVRLLR